MAFWQVKIGNTARQISDANSTKRAAAERSLPLLAIVSWQALPAIIPGAGQKIGGCETGLWTLARALALQNSVCVAIATAADRGGYPSCKDGVELWISVDRFAKTRRFVSDHIDLSPRVRVTRFHLSLLYRVPWLLVTRPLRNRDPRPMEPDPRLLNRSPAVWAAFGVTADSARTFATAIKQGKPSILFIQSNSDLDERLTRGEQFISRWGDPTEDRVFVLRHANTIVCQTPEQIEWLGKRFGRQGELIRNPIEKDAWCVPKRMQEQYVLWIGRYDSFHKRPLLMIRAAVECPSMRFKMVINPADSDVQAEVKRLKPPNVEITSHVPFEQVPQLFAGARLFVSTGDPICEGFPNVLLQAAASHTPIVSINHFPAFLKSSGAGVDCQGQPSRLAEQIRSLWDGHTIDWQAVDAYLAANHDLFKAAKRVGELVHQLLAFAESGSLPPRRNGSYHLSP